MKELTNAQLIEHFKDAIRDSNYNPTDTPYNQSKFTLDELEEEVFSRMR